VLARVRRSPEPPARPAWGSALAFFAYAIGFSLAYRLVPVGIGALLLFAAVQLTMVVAGLWSGERPRALEWAGHALSMAGVVALTRPGQARPDPLGATLMILAGAAWGAYSLRGRALGHAVARNAASFSRAVPLALATSAIGALLDPIRIDPAGAWLALASGAVASGMGFVLWYAALRRLTAIQATIVQLSVPLLAAAGGVLLLGESLSPRLLIAGTLVLGGIALAVAGRRRGGQSPTGCPTAAER
jgi:drug/metabolite transporter (DMT)-like permease